MEDRDPPEDLEALLDRLDEAAGDRDCVTLDRVMDEVGRRSFGPLLLVAGLIMAAPVVGDIPGVPPLLGLFVILMAVQLLVGRDHFWLPEWLLNRAVSSAKLRKTTGKWLRKPCAFVDRFLRRRWGPLTGSTATRLIAILAILLSLATPAAEFVPFSANLIGLAIALFGVALIAHDGAVALLGFVVVLAVAGVGVWALV